MLAEHAVTFNLSSLFFKCLLLFFQMETLYLHMYNDYSSLEVTTIWSNVRSSSIDGRVSIYKLYNSALHNCMMDHFPSFIMYKIDHFRYKFHWAQSKRNDRHFFLTQMHEDRPLPPQVSSAQLHEDRPLPPQVLSAQLHEDRPLPPQVASAQCMKTDHFSHKLHLRNA